MVLWFHPLAAFPKCETQLIAQLHFFLHFARSIPSFFNTLPVTSFFLHFVCHIAFFLQFGGCFVFFLQSPVPIAFFLTGKIGDPSVAFFLQDVSASLDCCNSGCISVCTFAFILHFFRFFPYFFYTLSFKLQKKCNRKNTLASIAFFCASVLGDVPGCIFRNPACEPIVGSHSLSQLCALPSSGGGVCDWRFSLEDSCQARTQQCTSYK